MAQVQFTMDSPNLDEFLDAWERAAEDGVDEHVESRMREQINDTARLASTYAEPTRTDKPHKHLADSYKGRVRKRRGNVTRAQVINRRPYAKGAEFGQHGKWKGFRQYGPRAERFAWRARQDKRDDFHRALLAAIERAAVETGFTEGE